MWSRRNTTDHVDARQQRDRGHPAGRAACGSCAVRGIPVHTDAVQAVGRIEVNFHALGVTSLAASAHKFHGPLGVGVLLVRRGVRLRFGLVGGGQQQGGGQGRSLFLWPWAWPRPSAVAFGGRISDTGVGSMLRDRLETGLTAALGVDRVIRNGPADSALRLPQTINLGFVGLDGDALLMQLDLAGIAVSLGSACASGSIAFPQPSLPCAFPMIAFVRRSASAWERAPLQPRSTKPFAGSAVWLSRLLEFQFRKACTSFTSLEPQSSVP